MKRINGFLDLDSYYKEIEKTNNWDYLDLYIKGFIRTPFDRKDHKWLKINGIDYYFKETDYPYTEMLAYELACVLGINAVSYDIAIFNDRIGTISKSYRKNDCKYVSGTKILMEYLNDENNLPYLCAMGFDEESIKGIRNNVHIAKELSNLEVIWQAIEYRYKKRNIDADIETIMEDLVNQFMFNIIAMQNDGFPENWELEESANGVSVVPIFDNEQCFRIKRWFINPTNMLSTNFNDAKKDNHFMLEEFFRVSSDEYRKLFIEKYNLISIEVFESLIKRVEDKIGVSIPEIEKLNYINMFKYNKDLIDKVLSKYSDIRTK